MLVIIQCFCRYITSVPTISVMPCTHRSIHTIKQNSRILTTLTTKDGMTLGKDTTVSISLKISFIDFSMP